MKEQVLRFMGWLKSNVIMGTILAAWAAAVFSNGALGTHFDINAIWQGLLAWIAKRGIDSKWNSKEGEPPK